MRTGFFLIRLLLLATCAAPATAQSVEQDLPATSSLELALWSADLEVILEPGATPHLKAHAVIVKQGATEAVPAGGPTVALHESGQALQVRRTAESEAVRLRVEVTLDVARAVRITGRDLDVTVQGPPLDFRKMAMRRRMAMERGEEQMAPTWTDVTLQIEDSRADLSGVAGGVLEGRNSWFVVRHSANQLTVKLEGGAAELEVHRGLLNLEAQGGEIELRDGMGEIRFQMEGAILDISDAEGKLEGQARNGATVRLYDWGGPVDVESAGSLLDLQSFRPGSQELYVLAESSDVTVEAMASGQLELEQNGGRLRVLDVQGKMKITASREAEVELERLRGPWKGIFEDSRVVADQVERFNVELTNAAFRLEGAEDLRLTASGSEITASEVRKISLALLLDSTADLGLAEGGRAQLEARGQSRVSVRMSAPCFVLAPSPQRGETRGRRGADGTAEDGEAPLGLDVSGCTVGGNIDRGDQDEHASPSFLNVTLDDQAELDVHGM